MDREARQEKPEIGWSKAIGQWAGNSPPFRCRGAGCRNGLLVTCGSDFHGKTKPATSLCQHGGAAASPQILQGLRAKGIESGA